jgi:hypothetical protein
MCRFFANKLWQVQEGLLPKNRIYPTYPFQFIGIDIAGPLFRLVINPVKLVKGKGKKKKSAEDEEIYEDEVTEEVKIKERKTGIKFYCLLFVCATTRAVDFQLITSTSTQSVVDAFQTFTAARGKPTYVLSDNAGSFEEANEIMQNAIRGNLSNRYAEITWAFIPTYSPWWGGQYEIFVRLLKRFLEKHLPKMRITSQLHAYQTLKGAEGVINSRPLYATSKGINDLEVITPMHYIRTGFNLEERYYPMNIDIPIRMYKQLKCDQSAQIQEFWLQLHQEYITKLREFHEKRGLYSKRAIKVGDIVLMKNESCARNYWPLAKVVRVYPSSKDGVIRTVRLQKYLPYAINAALKLKNYGKVTNKSLKANQIKELMGYFKTQKRKFDVNNLVPYELWKGDQAEPEDMDDGQVATMTKIEVGMNNSKLKGSVKAYWQVSEEMIQQAKTESSAEVHHVSFQNSRLKGSINAFYAMGYKNAPQSTIALFNELPNLPLMHKTEVWTGSEQFDDDLHEEVLAYWQCYHEEE